MNFFVCVGKKSPYKNTNLSQHYLEKKKLFRKNIYRKYLYLRMWSDLLVPLVNMIKEGCEN